jgi:hypothetical protein
MPFSPIALEFFLRLMVMRAGGEVTVMAESEELARADDLTLFAERVEGGIRFTTARTDDASAGHA